MVYIGIRKNNRRENVKKHLSLRMSGWHTNNHTQPVKKNWFPEASSRALKELHQIRITK